MVEVSGTSRRRQATRERLLDAACGVFAARGLGRTSIEQICEAAGYTRGAFYSNFTDVDELFFALFEHQVRRTVAQVSRTLDEAAPQRSVPELVDDVVAALDVDRDWLIVRTEFMLHAARTPSVRTTLTAHRATMAAALHPALAQVAGNPALPPELRSPDRLARMVMAVHNGVSLELLLDPDPELFRRNLRDLLVLLLDHSRS